MSSSIARHVLSVRADFYNYPLFKDGRKIQFDAKENLTHFKRGELCNNALFGKVRTDCDRAQVAEVKVAICKQRIYVKYMRTWYDCEEITDFVDSTLRSMSP